MKNSFYLVIPKQQANKSLSASYEKTIVNDWLADLPTANPSLSTRIFYDYIDELNHLELPVQKRLEVLELLRPQFLIIKDGLRSRLISTGFPKSESELKIFDLLISIEKNFTLGYWIAVRELTRRSVGWLQGKNAALAIQRTIKGLSGIVVNHYMLFLVVPDWVWIDLHSLYKLSVKNKKEATKIPDESSLSGKQSSAEDCYKQILLLTLTDPSCLMQKEMQQVYNFIGKISQFAELEQHPVGNQYIQCVIQTDEDKSPYYTKQKTPIDNSKYLNLNKVYKALEQEGKYCDANLENARFSSIILSKQEPDKLPLELFQYVMDCWKGIKLKGAPFFSDRLDRYIAVGLGATHSLQDPQSSSTENQSELLAESYSETELSCKFKKEGILSIGSLVSFRRTKEPMDNRSLGFVIKKTLPNLNGQIIFELSPLAQQSYAVTYHPIDSEKQDEHKKALLYAIKEKKNEKSCVLMDSFSYKDGDVLRLYMENEDFPVILGRRKNVGLGYWQFECRRIAEKQVSPEASKQGYDFF